jgi:NADH-quinone oxidoreductase subunit A
MAEIAEIGVIENILVVAILIGVCLLIDVIIVLLANLLPRKNPTFFKIQRFEAGNPPVATPKYILPMQYVGYLFMFMACEPILVLFLVFSANPSQFLMILLLLGFILLLPSIYVSYRYAFEIAYGGS